MFKPRTLQLEITNDCNLACNICMRSTSRRKVGYLNIKEFKKIPIEDFKEVAFHGWGEPLLHPKLFEIISLAGKRGVETSLITNGMLLDSRMEELLGSNLDSIAFGIFTTKSKENVFNNIREFCKKNKNIKTFIDITILPWNLDEIREIVEFAGEAGVDAVVLHKLFYAHNPNLKPLSEREVKLACKIAEETGKNMGIKVYTPPKKRRPCAVALSCMFLGWELVASPCCFLHEMGYHYSKLNINEHRFFLMRMGRNEVCKKCPW